MDRLEVDNILRISELKSELEFERATIIHGKLRWMQKKDSSLEPIYQHLKTLIKRYEKAHWNENIEISEKQISESDIAEKVVLSENEFMQKRKQLIREKLKEIGIAQKDLAKLLGHRANYMSELINGVRPFSRDDIVVIHRLFEIDFDDLIPQYLKTEVTNHIKLTLGELKNAKKGLKMRDLEMV